MAKDSLARGARSAQFAAGPASKAGSPVNINHGMLSSEPRVDPKIAPNAGPSTVTKFNPLHDKVLIRRDAEEEVTVGGIIIPDSGKDKPLQGTVISIGRGVRENGVLVPLSVVEGDRILFGKYSGTEIQLDGETLLIMREEEILGTVTVQEKKAKVGK